MPWNWRIFISGRNKSLTNQSNECLPNYTIIYLMRHQRACHEGLKFHKISLIANNVSWIVSIFKGNSEMQISWFETPCVKNKEIFFLSFFFFWNSMFFICFCLILFLFVYFLKVRGTIPSLLPNELKNNIHTYTLNFCVFPNAESLTHVHKVIFINLTKSTHTYKHTQTLLIVLFSSCTFT